MSNCPAGNMKISDVTVIDRHVHMHPEPSFAPVLTRVHHKCTYNSVTYIVAGKLVLLM